MRWITVIVSILPFLAVAQLQVNEVNINALKVNPNIEVGAEQLEQYLPMIQGKRVGLVANHTSLVPHQTGYIHLVDTLLARGVGIQAVFAPEHGFRGDAGNGERITDGRDAQTGLPVRSLYGKTKKPTPAMLADIDILLFDMQDVGTRFYTYLSTMHYVLEAAAEEGLPVIVLDRPNPNGFYVDGPILDAEYSSFVGMHPIPVVHGMTLGELAKMIVGEEWLKNKVQPELIVIHCKNYHKSDLYELPVAPSPNLPTMTSVYLYPSLCFFEPTAVSVGRGTDYPFELYGYPGMKYGAFTFTPESRPGKSLRPKHEGIVCSGQRLTEFGSFYFHANKRLYLQWLIATYNEHEKKDDFFTSASFFDKLAGGPSLRKQLEAGTDEREIRASWVEGLQDFKSKRAPYLVYPETR